MPKNYIKGIKRIGKIENFYGGLMVKSENNKYFWAIKTYIDNDPDCWEWEEIPKKLYQELIKFNSTDYH